MIPDCSGKPFKTKTQIRGLNRCDRTENALEMKMQAQTVLITLKFSEAGARF